MLEESIREHVQREFMDDRPDVVLTTDTDLIAESIIDSLGLFILLSHIEEQYRVEIEAEEVTFDNFRTVGTIADLVRSKQAVRASV